MRRLRDFTSARVDLPTAGDSLATAPLLDLRLAQARARDAVHLELDPYSLQRWPSLILRSQAKTRDEYLRRPDLGRLLDSSSLSALSLLPARSPYAFVIADGLSALAVHRHAIPFLEIVFKNLNWHPDEYHPVFLVQQGRVAIGDELGEAIAADLSIILIGERPGLSSPDSLGVYLTWSPRRGRTDAGRNCISNIHANGLSYELAAHKLLFLIHEARRRKLSGVAIKETAGQLLSMKNEQGRLPE